jgi:hypothetical protein
VSREIDFTFGSSTLGDVQVIARIERGRAPPLATSESARLDPGDVPEVEVLHVRAFDEHDRAIEILHHLTPMELNEIKAGAIFEAERLEENDE